MKTYPDSLGTMFLQKHRSSTILYLKPLKKTTQTVEVTSISVSLEAEIYKKCHNKFPRLYNALAIYDMQGLDLVIVVGSGERGLTTVCPVHCPTSKS